MPSCAKACITALQKQLAQQPQGFAARVKHALRPLLLAGSASHRQVAAHLNIHPRTMGRRLEAEGLTFEQLKDEVRLVASRDLLARTEMAISDVAAALGYATPSAFVRAFRRWTGSPPSAWRREVPQQGRNSPSARLSPNGKQLGASVDISSLTGCILGETVMKLRSITLAAIGLAAAFCGSAAAQQVTGTLGSPSATTTISGKQLPAPDPAFGGVIKDNALQSTPWWAPRIVPPKGAPNVLLIMTDDSGYGVPSTFGGVIPTPALDRVAAGGPALHRRCIRPRCARPPVRRSSPAATIIRRASA